MRKSKFHRGFRGVKNYLRKCTVPRDWNNDPMAKKKKKKKEKIASIPRQISNQAWEVELSGNGSLQLEGRSINFRGIYLWHSGRGIEFGGDLSRGEAVDFAWRKKEEMGGSLVPGRGTSMARHFQTRLDKTADCSLRSTRWKALRNRSTFVFERR